MNNAKNKKRKNPKSNRGTPKTNKRGVSRTHKNTKRKSKLQSKINEKNNTKKRSSHTGRSKKISAAKKSKNNTKKKSSTRSYYRQSKLKQNYTTYRTTRDKPFKVRDTHFRLSTTNFIDVLDDDGRIRNIEVIKSLALKRMFPTLDKITKRQKKWPRFFHIMIEYFDGEDFTFISGPLNDGYQKDVKKDFTKIIERLHALLPQYIEFLPSMNITGFRFILYPTTYKV